MTGLMIKRFKVIADYPGNDYFVVGEIITKKDDGYYAGLGRDCDIEAYPHLFRELQWYEEREIGEMPEFIKNSDIVIKPFEYFKNYAGEICFQEKKDSFPYTLENYLPATLQEYNDYIKSKK